MASHFTSWEERPERLFSTHSNGADIRASEDDSLPHPTARWIQDQNKMNTDTALTDELDQYGIPIHPHHSPSSSRTDTRRTSQNATKQVPSSSPSNAVTSSALKPSSSSRHLLSVDPSSSSSTFPARREDDDEDESIGLLLGQSKRRRDRKNSQTSLGSSVLPPPLFASQGRYSSAFASSRQPGSAKQGRSTYPASNHSGAAPRSRQLAPPRDVLAHQHLQLEAQTLRHRESSNASASRPSGFDLQDWLRTSQPPSALKTSPSLGALGSFDRSDRPGRAGAMSEAGNRHRRPQGGSTSGLSAGVLSAGPESPRSRRKSGTARARQDNNSFAALSPDHPALKASHELSREAENRAIDTIEEWRAKSGTQHSQASMEAADHSEQATRRRRKSSLKSSSRPLSIDASPPPLPSIPQTFTSGSITSRSGRSKRGVTAASLANFSSPDAEALSQTKATTLQGRQPALRNLYALSGVGSQAETPIRRLIRWLAKQQLKAIVTPLVLLSAFLVRWIIGRGDWSGRGMEPMHGDFEAQRHWIELTLRLPTSEWYFYDLQYWGLDYPPLTAWVSLACGYASKLFPSTAAAFAFETSRGNEDVATATFMRATVIVGDLLCYLPAVMLFVSRKLEGRGTRTQAIALFSVLLQPALILIDHGHFQYNSIMLGFSAACFALLYTTLPRPDIASSFAATGQGRSQAVADLSRRLSYEYVAAAIFFCLSLSFKQMALYYAPAVFAVMLGRCVGLARLDPERGLTLFIGLGLAVITTFGLVFAPWITSLEQVGQLVHRIFPLARGLFEDKVANVWCFLSVLPLPARFKIRNIIPATALARLSLLVTLVTILPGCCLLFWSASQTAKMEMMVAVETVQNRRGGKSDASVAGSVKGAPTAASHRGQRSPSVVGSIRGGPARSEIDSLLAGSVSRSISGRISQAGAAPDIDDRLEMSRDSDYNLASTADTRPIASTLPSPAAQMLPYGLINVSTAFFLFGFQTHEKSILLPLLPMTLMLGAKGDIWGGNVTAARDWEWIVWFNNIATFSLFPLLKKDGQSLQYVVLTLTWNWFIGNLAVPFSPISSLRHGLKPGASFFRRLSTLTYLAAAALHVAEVAVPWAVPGLQARVWARYPDIYPVINVLITTPCFGVIFLWALIRQVQVAIANGLSVSSTSGARGKVVKKTA